MDQKERKKISDGAYKYAFADDVIMWELVNKIAREKLVNPISLANLQQCKSRFVSPSLDQREADVVYEVLDTNGKPYLYILIEHQSSVEKIMPFRMFLYTALLYHDAARKSQSGQFPKLLPILLYNGKEKWRPPLDVDGLTIPGILKNTHVDFHCAFIDEKRYPVEKLLEFKGSMAAIIYMEQLNKEMFKENRETVIKNLEIMLEQVKPQQMLTIGHWINHMFRCRLRENEVIKRVQRKEVIAMLTEVLDDFRQEGIQEGTEKGWQEGILEGTAKGWQEGIQEGTAKGWQDGILEGTERGIRKTAKAMVEQGAEVDFIHKVTGLSLEEIRGLGHT